jgi:hypothetical protein
MNRIIDEKSAEQIRQRFSQTMHDSVDLLARLESIRQEN